MTARDRLMLIAMVAVAILAGGYIVVVAPERQKASKLSGEVQKARQQLQSAETQAAEATSARSRYAASYTSLVSLGPAVPASGETPSLVYALASATHNRNVEFQSIATGSGSGGSSSASSSSGPASATAATFTQEPFTFDFQGSFVDLYKLLDQMESFTNQTAAGSLRVSGRLLTIDGIQFGNGPSGSSTVSSAAGGGAAKGGLGVTVTATAYVLPPGQTPLGGASPGAPAGVTPASSTPGASSPVSPAVIKAGP